MTGSTQTGSIHYLHRLIIERQQGVQRCGRGCSLCPHDGLVVPIEFALITGKARCSIRIGNFPFMFIVQCGFSRCKGGPNSTRRLRKTRRYDLAPAVTSKNHSNPMPIAAHFFMCCDSFSFSLPFSHQYTPLRTKRTCELSSPVAIGSNTRYCSRGEYLSSDGRIRIRICQRSR